MPGPGAPHIYPGGVQSGYRRWVGPVTFVVLTVALGLLIARDFDLTVRWVSPVDFLTYRLGALGAWQGTDIYAANLYGPAMPDEGLPFTYTPFAALLFGPLTWLPAPAAVTLWSGLTVAVVAASLWLMSGTRALPGQPTMRFRVPLLLILTVVACYSVTGKNHLAFGQIGAWLMLLILADAVRSEDSRLARVLPPGVLIGVAAAIKLTPTLFIVFFGLVRRWRLAAVSAASAVAVTLAATLIRPELSWGFVKVLPRLSERVSLGRYAAGTGNQTVSGFFLALHLPAAALIASIVVAIIGLLVARRVFAGGGLVVAVVFVGLLATAVSPIAWKHHWVFVFPALVLLWRVSGIKGRTLVMALTAVSTFDGPDASGDLLGGNLAEQALGWVLRESLLLTGIAVMIWLYLTFARNPVPATSGSEPRSSARTAPIAVATAVDHETSHSTVLAAPDRGSA